MLQTGQAAYPEPAAAARGVAVERGRGFMAALGEAGWQVDRLLLEGPPNGDLELLPRTAEAPGQGPQE